VTFRAISWIVLDFPFRVGNFKAGEALNYDPYDSTETLPFDEPHVLDCALLPVTASK
jgi:hypothetical protein